MFRNISRIASINYKFRYARIIFIRCLRVIVYFRSISNFGFVQWTTFIWFYANMALTSFYYFIGIQIEFDWYFLFKFDIENSILNEKWTNKRRASSLWNWLINRLSLALCSYFNFIWHVFGGGWIFVFFLLFFSLSFVSTLKLMRHSTITLNLSQ